MIAIAFLPASDAFPVGRDRKFDAGNFTANGSNEELRRSISAFVKITEKLPMTHYLHWSDIKSTFGLTTQTPVSSRLASP
jgi:hypothetical protein